MMKNSIFFNVFFVLRCLIAEPIGINVEIEDTRTYLTFTGHAEDFITETDLATFHITDNTLKRGIAAFTGRYEPAEISLGDWKDDYERENWCPVKKTVAPIRGKILKRDRQPWVISRQRLTNTFYKKGNYKASIASSITSTLSSSWSESNAKSYRGSLSLDVRFFSASADVTFTTEWGKSNAKENSTTVGCASEVSVDLEPGEEVDAILMVTREYVDIQVDYVAGLKGDVACRYSDHLSYFFGRALWRQDINTVLFSAGLPTRFLVKQTLSVTYYSMAKVALVNVTSHETIFQQPAVFGV